MKKNIIFLLFSFCASVFAQNKDIDDSQFPKISFVWHDYTPEVKKKTAFAVADNGTEVPAFDFTHSQRERNKSVLVLWEDMSSNGIMPYNFTKNVLSGFFNENMNSNDKFAVYVFNRERNNENLLNPISDFATDKPALANAVGNYSRNTIPVAEQPKYSDLYKAIYKGLDLLNAEPAENVKAIVVFTVGWNLRGGGAQSELAAVEQKAKAAHIPVYVVLFPIHGEKLEINTLADDTYGKVVATLDATVAEKELFGFYNNLNQRHTPHEYIFTFTSNGSKYEPHKIMFSVDGTSAKEYTVQAHEWLKENSLLVIIIVLLLLIAIAVVIVLIAKKQREKTAAVQTNLEEIQRESEAKANAARAEVERAKQQQFAYQNVQERKRREAEEKAENERLANLMRTKNLYPRLQCKVGDNTFIYNVSQVTTTIGRNENNSLVLPHKTVSGQHSKIVFIGNGFEIQDLKSTNKMIINGQFQERATLKNGDIIGLGEAIITFYL